MTDEPILFNLYEVPVDVLAYEDFNFETLLSFDFSYKLWE